ncbi:MAG: AAA family ATPase [Prevotella sp.]|nr:AAA family ATPase [Prevotella sp.]
MASKNVYQLADKKPEDVKKSFIFFMDDKDATRKQIKDAKNSRYAKIDVIKTICDIVKNKFNVQNILFLTDSKSVQVVSDEISQLIAVETDVSAEKELKNLRSYVNKYKEFLVYCEKLAESPNTHHPYSFESDSDKPFISEESFMDIVNTLQRKKNVILQGAPGVGKTFLAKKIAYQLMGEVKEGNIDMVQFHQSYSYEDFIQGIRPTTAGTFEVRNGVFYKFCQRAKENEDESFVFIIDEINRGNLSKIFGELMMLIESDKRSPRHAIKLTYSDDEEEKFYVPANVYIIGCMNTADRSLAIVDYALRRRFAFCDIEPEFGETFQNFLSENLSVQFVNRICSKLKRANKIIVNAPSLGKGLEIGHSYFCQTADVDDEQQWWRAICNYELFPYIREICFDDNELFDEICNILAE